jgi:ankyrin repeat protein
VTPEEFVALCAGGDIEGVRAALDAGIDPNTSLPFEDGETHAQIPALYHACVGDHRDVVLLLLERGANPDDGESVFHAAQLNHRAVLEILLAHGADISNACAPYGNTPLFFLAGYQDASPSAATATLGMRWLLEHGADPNVTSGDEKETPLQRCAQHGRREVVALLLDHGADPHMQRADGRTAYALAVRGGHNAIASLLESRGGTDAELTPIDRLIGACARGDEAHARAILAKAPSLLASFTADDRAAVVQAVYDGRIDAVRAMHVVGFDLAWEGTWGGTPLHHAAWLGNVAMTRLLLELGSPVNLRDRRFGSSPLGWAAHGSHNCRPADDDYLAVIHALLDSGADRASSINTWGGPPESLGSERVAAFLKESWKV